MLINWETLPTILCLWMAILVSVQYSKLLSHKNIILCVAYFFILFISGLPWLTPYAAALRTWASGFFLTIIWLNAGDSSAKKMKALLKFPLITALLAYSFYDKARILGHFEVRLGCLGILLFSGEWSRLVPRTRYYGIGNLPDTSEILLMRPPH